MAAEAMSQPRGNQPPSLNPIGSRSVEENQLLTIPVSATDGDGPLPLLLTATNLPTGATFTDFGDGFGESCFAVVLRENMLLGRRQQTANEPGQSPQFELLSQPTPIDSQ